jgi:hypothetical protein
MLFSVVIIHDDVTIRELNVNKCFLYLMTIRSDSDDEV